MPLHNSLMITNTLKIGINNFDPYLFQLLKIQNSSAQLEIK
jgi:hypothetical protein